jgi:cell division protein FtsZ
MMFEMLDNAKKSTVIKVVGVGGAGGNAVSHMIRSGVQGVDFICCNTDAQALAATNAPVQIRLGSSGLGAGAKPDQGRAAAESAREEIRSALAGAHMVFITAGMGGGTGTGAGPIVAEVAKDLGILTVGVVTKPFSFEGNRRMKMSEEGIDELSKHVHSLIVVLNEKLLEVLGDDVSQDEAFAYANDVLKNAVGGIAEIINVPGHVNVDFEDVRTVMSEQGKAMMGTALAKGPDRARIAAEQAVACPLLEGIDLSGAKGVLVLITAAKGSLKLSESKLAMNTIRAFASSEAHVIYGTAYDDSLVDQVRVTVVATGLGRQGTHRRTAPPLQVLRTGTDNVPFNVPTLNNAVGNAGVQRGSSVSPMASMGGASAATSMGASAAPQADYGTMSTPAVWRGTRTSAAQKVDALSSGGMDDYEIPAFLRKQAD